MTLKQIAAELGVSPSIVSRVVNGYSRNFSISEELRKKILDKVAECHYRANPIFRTLSVRDNRHVGFLFHGVSAYNIWGPERVAFEHLGKILEAQNFEFSYLFDRRAESEPLGVPACKSFAVVAAGTFADNPFRALEEGNQPYVALNSHGGPGGAAVLCDEIDNLRLTMNHLTELGHRKIGYLNKESLPRQHYSVPEREKAFLQYIAAHRLPLLDGYQSSTEPVDVRLDRFLKQGATAIVTYNSELGKQALCAAWRRNIRIPAQLSVIAFNNNEDQDYSIPPLSGVAMPEIALAEHTAEILIAKYRDPDFANGTECRLPGRLVLRESTAPVPINAI